MDKSLMFWRSNQASNQKPSTSKGEKDIPHSSGLPTKSVYVNEWKSEYRSTDNSDLIRQYGRQEIDTTSGVSKTTVSRFVRSSTDRSNIVKTYDMPESISEHNAVAVKWDDIASASKALDNEIEYMDVETEEDMQMEVEGETDKKMAKEDKRSGSKSKLIFTASKVVETRSGADDSQSSMPQFERNLMKSTCLQGESAQRDLGDQVRTKKQPTKRDRPRSKGCCKYLTFFIVMSLLIGLASIILQQRKYRHSSDFVDAVVELKKRIYGQERAVEILSEYLLLDEIPFKVIALVGGTGVGKSYTVEIIKKNFPRKYFITDLLPPIENDIFILYPHLIILENLREHDLLQVMNFLYSLQMDVGDRYITVLAVFNLEEMDDNARRSIDLDESLDKLNDFFADEGINATIIPYWSLHESALEKCIEDAARNSRLTLSAKQVDLVKQYLLTNNAGCKGAYAKVQLIGRQ